MTPEYQPRDRASGHCGGTGKQTSPRGPAAPAGQRSLVPAYALLGFSVVLFLIALTTLVHRLVVRARDDPAAPAEASLAVLPGDAAASIRTAIGTEPLDSSPGGSGSGVDDDRGGGSASVAPQSEEADVDGRVGQEAVDAAEVDHPVETDVDHPLAGSIRLQSIPRAQVYVDGRAMGLTPVTLERSPGSRARVLLVASGREIYRKTVETSSDGPVDLTARLMPAKYPRYVGRRRGVLKVLCRRADPRRIFINGRDSGYSCPKVAYYLRPGRYRIGFHDPVSGHTTTVRARVRARRVAVLRLRHKPAAKGESNRRRR